MHEVKTPKKPLIFYYGITLLVLVAFNFLLMLRFLQAQVRETDYGTFMSMAEGGRIGKDSVQDNKILFTDKEENIYKTGRMEDPDLTQRLYDSGAEFTKEIIE